MALKKGISIVVKIVETIITLMAAMIGPIEFSAKTENKKASDATVIIDKAAKPYEAPYRHSMSERLINKSLSVLKTNKSLVPNNNIEPKRPKRAMNVKSKTV